MLQFFVKVTMVVFDTQLLFLLQDNDLCLKISSAFTPFLVLFLFYFVLFVFTLFVSTQTAGAKYEKRKELNMNFLRC